jgi:hypothetical protein
MKYFANVDANNLVVTVIAVEEDSEHIDGYVLPSWVETNPNMMYGVLMQEGTKIPATDQSGVFRKNYAGVGFSYDAVKDAFIPPKLFESWVFDDFKCAWIPPEPYPNDTQVNYLWDEPTLSWIIDPRDELDLLKDQ